MSFTLDRPPKNDDELYDLVKVMWGITIPRHKVCAEHQAPFDAFSTAFFAREPQVMIWGSRGLAGKSQLMSILGLTQAVVWGSDVNILGGSFAQSTNVLEHMSRAWDYKNAPKYMQTTDNKAEQLLTNNAKIRALTASQRTVRGPHPPRLLLDEIDEMDQDIFDAAKGQPMPKKNWLDVTVPAQTTMASTWQYSDKTMASEMKRFREEDMPIYAWCFRETSNPIDGWLDPKFIDQKRREMPRAMWETEYELGEPSIGNRAFMPDAVERMFDVGAPKPLRNNKEHQEYKILDWRQDRDYVAAADWAKEQDWTVITVWDVTETPIRLAYYLRIKRRPYPVMIGMFNRLIKDYRADAIHDATGLGNVVSDLIDSPYDVWNFLMTGRQRDDMLSEFVAAVENDQVRASRIDTFQLSVKYASTDDLFRRGNEYHLPDEVCSAALAWKAVSNRYPLAAPIPTPKGDNWMEKAVENNTDSGWTLQGEVEKRDEGTELLFY